MERSAAACGGHGVLSERGRMREPGDSSTNHFSGLFSSVSYLSMSKVKWIITFLQQRGNSELICLAEETKTRGEERAWKRGRRAAAGQKRLMEEFSDAI